jgi:glycosyltransferase involved in cell wall biosynthesis
MKVLHLPVAFLPWTMGGREIFTYNLAKILQKKDVENHICIHQDPSEREPLGTSIYKGLPVMVLPKVPDFNERLPRYTRVYKDIPGFKEYLIQLHPDIVHFHDHSAGASLSHLRIVKDLGLKAVATYHSPGQSCLQSQLLYLGKSICDGYIDNERCTKCRLVNTGVPAPIASILSITKVPSFTFMNHSQIGRLLTAHQMTKLFHESFDEIYSKLDFVQVHTNWVKVVLLKNGVSPDKILFSRMGLFNKQIENPEIRNDADKTLKLAYVGRCSKEKGIHVLIDAVKSLPSGMAIQVNFWGPYWNTGTYGKEMLAKISNDNRFMSPELLPNDQIVEKLSKMDALIIPSLWMETGPITFFDAQAALLPVIGSNLGGIAELVKQSQNGFLFEPGNTKELSGIIQKIYSEEGILDSMKANIKNQKSRKFEDMAEEIFNAYKNLIYDK